MSGRLLLVLAVCGVLSGGCASPAPAPSASSASSASAAAPVAPVPPSGPTAGPTGPGGSAGACAEQVTVTETETGRTVCVLAGGTVTVRLGPPWGTPHVDDATVLEPTTKTLISATFTARHAGATKVTATQPACPSAEPGHLACHALRAFIVTVQVR